MKEESVEVEQIAEVWRLDPMIFGYTYKFAFTLEPEEGYFFGENTVVKLHGKECSVIASADGTAAIECEITTDPAHVTVS